MKTTIKTLLTITIAFSMVGCAAWNNSITKRGGVIGTYASSYIVINYSGGQIMDIWKLDNAYVQSEQQSDGWLFTDANGNSINIGGDAKLIRVNNKSGSQWDSIKEYHRETNLVPYEDFIHAVPAR